MADVTSRWRHAGKRFVWKPYKLYKKVWCYIGKEERGVGKEKAKRTVLSIALRP